MFYLGRFYLKASQIVEYFVLGDKSGMRCYVQGVKSGMGCFIRGGRNGMGCFVWVGKSLLYVLSEVSKMALDILFQDDIPGSLTDNMSSLFMWHCY